LARRIIDFVVRYQTWLLGAAVVLMAYATVNRIVPEFHRLVYGGEEIGGAIDLKTLHRLVTLWFEGNSQVGSRFAVYPPASVVMLWPFLGWLDVESSRWLWAITSAVVLAVLVVVLVRESGARTALQCAFVALILVSAKPAGQTIGNGQLTLHVLAAVLPSSSWAASRAERGGTFSPPCSSSSRS
jgi:hypothetical protein